MRSVNGTRPVVRLAVPILALLVAGLLFLAHAEKREAVAGAFYSTALKNAGVQEDVVVGGIHYHVADGLAYTDGVPASPYEAENALRTAYAKVMAERSPLMALAGTDPAAMLVSVDSLEQSASQLAALQKDAALAQLVRSSLYPTRFLRAMAELETARLRFAASGSDTDERAYEIAQYAAISAYKNDLRLFRQAFLHTVPADTAEFGNDATIISRSSTLHALDELASGIQQTSRLYEKRRECLGSGVTACNARNLDLPAIAAVPEYPVTDTDISRANEIRSILSRSRNNTEIMTAPLIQLSHSACATPSGLAPLFVVYHEQLPTDTAPFVRSSFVGDLRLYDTRSFRDIPYFGYFAALGISYINVPSTFYTCSETGSDFGRVYAVRSVSEFAKESEVSRYATGATAAELKTLEHTFAPANSILRESDTLQYLALAQTLANTGNLPQPLTRAVETLSVAATNATTDFDVQLDSIVSIEEGNVRLSHRNIPIPLSAPYLFFARNAFTLLFMSDTPSVVGTPAPFFKPNTVPQDGQPSVLYSSLPHTKATQNELVRDIHVYFGLHAAPENVPLEDLLAQ